MLVLTAEIDEMHKPLVEAMVAHLQKLTGDSSLALTSIERGSVKLVFDGSDEGLAQIEALVKSGRLTELYGFAIQDVHYVFNKKQSRPSGGGGDQWVSNPQDFYPRDAEAAYHEPRQSQSFGDISIHGSGNVFNATQGNNNTVSNNINQSANSLSNLQAAIELLAKLKQDVGSADVLTTYQKNRVQGDITLIEEELQKPKPDRNFVDEAIAALKQALEGVVILAEPVTKIAELLAKAWMV